MKEVKITIIGDNNSNTTKEFKGEVAILSAAAYLGDLVPDSDLDKCEPVAEEKLSDMTKDDVGYKPEDEIKEHTEEVIK